CGGYEHIPVVEERRPRLAQPFAPLEELRESREIQRHAVGKPRCGRVAALAQSRGVPGTLLGRRRRARLRDQQSGVVVEMSAPVELWRSLSNLCTLRSQPIRKRFGARPDLRLHRHPIEPRQYRDAKVPKPVAACGGKLESPRLVLAEVRAGNDV